MASPLYHASPIPSISAPSPGYILQSQTQTQRSRLASAASPAGSVASTRDSQHSVDQLQRAILKLTDDQGPLSVSRFAADFQTFQDGIDNAFVLAGNGGGDAAFDYEGRLQKLKTTLEAIETHLRLSGIGAVPLLELNDKSGIDLAKLIVDRGKMAKAGFETREKVKEASVAILGALNKA